MPLSARILPFRTIFGAFRDQSGGVSHPWCAPACGGHPACVRSWRVEWGIGGTGSRTIRIHIPIRMEHFSRQKSNSTRLYEDTYGLTISRLGSPRGHTGALLEARICQRPAQMPGGRMAPFLEDFEPIRSDFGGFEVRLGSLPDWPAWRRSRPQNPRDRGRECSHDAGNILKDLLHHPIKNV